MFENKQCKVNKFIFKIHVKKLFFSKKVLFSPISFIFVFFTQNGCTTPELVYT